MKPMRGPSAAAGVAVALVALACGSRTPVGVDEPDATVTAQDAGRRDASSQPPRDAGGRPDAGRDASLADAADAGDAGLHDAALGDAGDAGLCPPLYPAGLHTCTTLGTFCAYPEGDCLCFDRGQCGGCMPMTCLRAGYVCGLAGDGCGGLLQCGTCPSTQTCVQNQCVGPDAGCVRHSCAELGFICGVHDDGCGRPLDCGACYWSCNAAHPPCPVDEPAMGSPCLEMPQSCTYTRWSPGCCYATDSCVGGIWQNTSLLCPL